MFIQMVGVSLFLLDLHLAINFMILLSCCCNCLNIFRAKWHVCDGESAFVLLACVLSVFGNLGLYQFYFFQMCKSYVATMLTDNIIISLL